MQDQQNLSISQQLKLSLQVGDHIDSRYLIEQEIGKGGMGVVYRAQDNLLSKAVAVKVMQIQQDDQVSQRFKLEAKITTELAHPNIVAVRAFGIDSVGRPYLVMDYLNGIPLNDWIKKNPAANGSLYLKLARQIASGMAHAHQHQIIHRDLKASNIFITGSDTTNYEAKILDFGIAKLLNEENGLTCTGQIVGTPYYMSPEQALGHSADQRSDIYSYGCLIYEMFAGHPPFQADNMMVILSQHIHSEPQQSDIPSHIWTLIEKCLQKDPAKRYQSFQQVCTDLATLERGKTIGFDKAKKKKRASERLTIAVILVPLVGLLAMLMYFSPRRTQVSGAHTAAPAGDSQTQSNTKAPDDAASPPAGGQYFGSATPDDFKKGRIPPHQLGVRELGDAYSEADSFDEGSRRHFMKGEYDQAITMLEFQTQTYKEGGHHYGDPDIETVYLAMAYMHLGECYVQKRQQELAAENYRRALQLYATVDKQDPKMYDQAVFGYVTLLNNMGKTDAASKMQTEFMNTHKVTEIP